MAISREIVERLAEITRVGLSPDEAEELARDMSGILDHVAHIQAADTSGVPEGLAGGSGTRSSATMRSRPRCRSRRCWQMHPSLTSIFS